jgi:DNA polymerase-3 subunit alpha
VKNGLTKTKAEEIFHLIEPFAGYGFNKAHAACYAMIAYQTAYLKANFPVEYMTAVLTAESRANTGPARDDKMSSIVAECRRTNLALLPPDINASGVEFSVEGEKIRFGLSAVKNVGEAAIDSILFARESGRFVSFSDFIHRVDISKVNKKTLESLIKAGAMDAFGPRSAMLSFMPVVVEQAHKTKKQIASGQVGLFGEEDNQSILTDALPEVSELTQSELLAFEKELLGFYLTMHPLEPHRAVFASLSLTSVSEINATRVGDRVTVGGIVVGVKKIMTKASNKEMAFVKIEDLTGIMEIVVFPKIFATTMDLWNMDRIVSVSGKIDEKDDRLTLLVDEAKLIRV